MENKDKIKYKNKKKKKKNTQIIQYLKRKLEKK